MIQVEGPAKTALHRKKLSSPAMLLLKKGLLVGKVLDYGCGRGDLATFIVPIDDSRVGPRPHPRYPYPTSITQWDPHFFPKKPRGKFDTVVCIYVLNVLDPVSRKKALQDAQGYVKNNGRLYIAVRRDITDVTEGHKGVFQYPVKLDDPFVSIFRRSGRFEIYEWSPAW